MFFFYYLNPLHKSTDQNCLIARQNEHSELNKHIFHGDENDKTFRFTLEQIR